MTVAQSTQPHAHYHMSPSRYADAGMDILALQKYY